jgi:hypothetical protein
VTDGGIWLRSIAEYTGMRTVKAHYPDLSNQKSYTQDEVLNAHIVSDWHLGSGPNPCACPITFPDIGFGRATATPSTFASYAYTNVRWHMCLSQSSASAPRMHRCHLPKWFGGACASITDKFPRYRMVHIVRDPVEVVISGYLYHKHGPAHPTPLSTILP